MKSDEELVTVGLKLCSGPRQMETEMDEQGWNKSIFWICEEDMSKLKHGGKLLFKHYDMRSQSLFPHQSWQHYLRYYDDQLQ